MVCNTENVEKMDFLEKVNEVLRDILEGTKPGQDTTNVVYILQYLVNLFEKKTIKMCFGGAFGNYNN